ncbi:alpha/beta fold hydrolase [Geodermatophilus sp. DSM 45219]|uniref:alpha/beta fold hydrolase n=1 Tax=Geodermatophilus sp. DSM 45219 TaxID=1881103 RepID=UPI001C40A147|nr:alpha/beta fold hydrolase [Geodermatophilus sp. DSM 45219]
MANPLRALHSDAEFLRDLLEGVDGPIVVAGHSYGGSVMGEAADGHPRVKALVYVASFLLEEGESTGELAGKYPGNELGSALRPVPVHGPDGRRVDDLYIAQEKFEDIYAARPKATASGIPLIGGHFRVRHDEIDTNGTLTLRHNSRLHHIGLGRRYAGTSVLVVVHDLHVRVLSTSGRLLRDLQLDPDRDYQPQPRT